MKSIWVQRFHFQHQGFWYWYSQPCTQVESKNTFNWCLFTRFAITESICLESLVAECRQATVLEVYRTRVQQPKQHKLYSPSDEMEWHSVSPLASNHCNPKTITPRIERIQLRQCLLVLSTEIQYQDCQYSTHKDRAYRSCEEVQSTEPYQGANPLFVLQKNITAIYAENYFLVPVNR